MIYAIFQPSRRTSGTARPDIRGLEIAIEFGPVPAHRVGASRMALATHRKGWVRLCLAIFCAGLMAVLMADASMAKAKGVPVPKPAPRSDTAASPDPGGDGPDDGDVTGGTDGDGGFLRGKAVLAQLLGVSAGRFYVTSSTSQIEGDLDGTLATQLAGPIAHARAAMSLLGGAQMNTIARVRFDEEAIGDYLKATPERAQLVIRRLSNGAAPRELVLCGGCEPALLDDLLSDVAARGFVLGIEDAEGTYSVFIRLADRPGEFCVNQFQYDKPKTYRDLNLAIATLRNEFGYYGTIGVQTDRRASSTRS